MNSIKESYKYWSEIYDTNENKTRDLDLNISKEILSKIAFKSVLEIGCGTGKNTIWLSKKAQNIIAIDFSPEMLQIAKRKVKSNSVKFVKADITKPWKFIKTPVDLISINLVLEHIENLDFIFKNSFENLKKGAYLFISELHPFKQYTGSQAKFKTNKVKSFVHHISDFTSLAKKYNLKCEEIIESFDKSKNINEEKIPRLLSLLFKKD